MSDTVSSSRARKVRAFLAGGLVLGVGAAITLAAWNDSEFAAGTFGTGAFDLVGSTDGQAFANHGSEDAAVLGFQVEAASLGPGETVQAPFAVQLTEATTHSADVLVNELGATASLDGLSYTVTTTDTFGCEGASAPLIDSRPVSSQEAGVASFSLGAAASQTVNLCFTVTADADLPQGQSGTATWQFEATSLEQ